MRMKWECPLALHAPAGEILGIYPQTADGVGQFLVPRVIWEATPILVPNR